MNHRPPGGEPYCDVIMRLRSVIGTVTREHAAGDRVLVVCHLRGMKIVRAEVP